MSEPAQNERKHAALRRLAEFFLPALGFTLGVGLATGQWAPSFGTGLVISGAITGLYWLDQRFLHPQLERVSPDWVRLGLEMTFSLLEHVVGGVAALLICGRLFGFEVIPSAAWIVVGAMVLVFPIIHGTEMALRYFRQVQEKERQQAQLKALATEAELKALKAQISPHFLFNTLNTIAQLIHDDAGQAEATVERLAEMFRYLLLGSERGLVPLAEELSFVDDYLEIEQVRFGDRLRVKRNVAAGISTVPVPSLLLQPLVENAVRHGRGSDGSIDLDICVGAEAGSVVIAVADRGPGMPKDYKIADGSGYGLHNVDQRLRKTYGQEYGVEISSNQPSGTTVTLWIPLVEDGWQG